jgi:adenine-specific DNA-methyltransferase
MTQVNDLRLAVGQIQSGDELLRAADQLRRQATARIEPAKKAELGQFLTSASLANMMASMFETKRRHIRLLDPGAGSGILTAAFLVRQVESQVSLESVSVIAYEIDPLLKPYLEKTMDYCRSFCKENGIRLDYEVRQADFISECADRGSLFDTSVEWADCVIMNPPYRKINSASATRKQLRCLGIETSNLYTAFMLLAARLLKNNGEFVSINPRSFCNGPYFRPFRREFLRLLSLRRIHVFESRDEVFRHDEVLQENVIVYGRRTKGPPRTVTISHTSARGMSARKVPYEDMVKPDDPDAIIHLATDDNGEEISAKLSQLPCTLVDLGLSASTGRVVDFRAREYLRATPQANTVPLIYPTHLRAGRVIWPNGSPRKPKAIVTCQHTSDLLVPTGFYVLVKRFSAKEERRRVVAALFEPGDVPTEAVGFDNKTNYIHRTGGGLPEDLARGLTVYLNSSAVDTYFRLFSGHTQVNATDLRRLPIPDAAGLVKLARDCTDLGSQENVDTAVGALLYGELL